MTTKVLTDGSKSATILVAGTETETIDLATVLSARLLEGKTPTHCTITGITYDVCSGGSGYITISWGSSDTIAHLAGHGQIIAYNVGTPSIPNETEQSTITITNNGAKAFTVVIEIRKNGQDFDVGQLSEPNYYNQDRYGVTPRT